MGAPQQETAHAQRFLPHPLRNFFAMESAVDDASAPRILSPGILLSPAPAGDLPEMMPCRPPPAAGFHGSMDDPILAAPAVSSVPGEFEAPSDDEEDEQAYDELFDAADQ